MIKSRFPVPTTIALGFGLVACNALLGNERVEEHKPSTSNSDSTDTTDTRPAGEAGETAGEMSATAGEGGVSGGAGAGSGQSAGVGGRERATAGSGGTGGVGGAGGRAGSAGSQNGGRGGSAGLRGEAGQAGAAGAGGCAVDGDECDDGDACTLGSTCKAGTCERGPTPKPCNDDNPCTDDSCDPKIGCKNQNNVAPCDDSNKCTEGDKCMNGTCRGGDRVECPAPAEACSRAECVEPSAGCVTMPAPNGEACGVGRVCKDGICACSTGLSTESRCDDGMDDDCDGQADCADADCNNQQCSAVGTSRCCSSVCVDIATDPNNCAGCGQVCERPPAYQGGERGLDECTYIQECDYPNHAAGTVCRLYTTAPGCGDINANINECRREIALPQLCGGRATPPFWYCNKSSTDCRLISAL